MLYESEKSQKLLSGDEIFLFWLTKDFTYAKVDCSRSASTTVNQVYV